MIDLYYWPTPNGHKITIFLEETRLEYRIVPINILKGNQHDAAFLSRFPNGRIPAIVDRDGAEGQGEPLYLFESGAILLHLAEKTGKLIPADARGRLDVLQWLFWQVGGLGPMAGQTQHFRNYAPDRIRYAVDRYTGETARLYSVLNARLARQSFIAGEYSIADIACYPWIVPHQRHGQEIARFSHLWAWFERMSSREAVVRAYARASEVEPDPPETLSAEARAALFGQNA